MSNLFNGMVLLFLNFNINIGRSSIGLLPDFLGFIFIVNGVKELSNESEFFKKVNPYARNMTYFTLVLYILNFLGLRFGYTVSILQFIASILGLYVSYLCIKGIIDMEELNGWDLQGKSLYVSWVVLAVLSIITSTIGFLARFGAIILILGNFITIIVYLFHFNQAKRLYLDITNEYK